MLTHDTVISRPSPNIVEYRTPTGFGAQVVKVMLLTNTPRLIAWAEGPLVSMPMSLFLDEYLEFIQDACRRLERPLPRLEWSDVHPLIGE